MKTFEEKFTAWIDGELTGKELADFEAGLAGVKEAGVDRIAAHCVGDLLRGHGGAPELQNADFFNHQLMQRIDAETPGPGIKPARPLFSWSLSRFACAGVCSLLIAVALFYFMIPVGPRRSTPASGELAILNTHSGDPTITVTAFHSKDNKVTVLWLDGLKYIPEDKKQK
jgi:hypothetical protein